MMEHKLLYWIWLAVFLIGCTNLTGKAYQWSSPDSICNKEGFDFNTEPLCSRNEQVANPVKFTCETDNRCGYTWECVGKDKRVVNRTVWCTPKGMECGCEEVPSAPKCKTLSESWKEKKYIEVRCNSSVYAGHRCTDRICYDIRECVNELTGKELALFGNESECRFH